MFTVTETLLANEFLVRLAFFAGVFTLIALWEAFLPRRPLPLPRRVRWPGNLGIVVLNTVVLRLISPTAALGVAFVAADNGFGLFNLVPVPAAVAVVLSVVLLDSAIYLQHVLFHAVPALWRLHRMHHADLGFDVTTGTRFHPIEMVLSLGIKIAVVAALGAPALGVLAFEVVLNATAMFNHGNVFLPEPVDRVLRLFVVTPDMHRVHHSVAPREANSNFGFNLPWWDRLLGTYRAQPAAGHLGMILGIDQFRDPRELRLDRMLVQPFHGPVGDYSILRRAGPRDASPTPSSTA